MDWATAAIEAVGLLILGIWIVIPIQEFQQILAKIREEKPILSEPPGGFEVHPSKPPPRPSEPGADDKSPPSFPNAS